MKIKFTHTQGDVPVTIVRAKGVFDASSADYFKDLIEAEIINPIRNNILTSRNTSAIKLC